MKKKWYLFWCVLFVVNNAFSQIDFKREIIPITSFFLAGTFDGVAETLKWHYWEFEEVHPNINNTYWDPKLSWVNKYSNGNPQNGPAFPLSTTTLVWTTDGYHLMRFGKVIFATIGIVFTPDLKGQKWYIYVAKAALYSISYSAGFHVTYSLIY